MNAQDPLGEPFAFWELVKPQRPSPECSDCGKLFSSMKWKIVQHLWADHGVSTAGETNTTNFCHWCREYFVNPHRWEDHCASHHQKVVQPMVEMAQCSAPGDENLKWPHLIEFESSVCSNRGSARFASSRSQLCQVTRSSCGNEGFCVKADPAQIRQILEPRERHWDAHGFDRARRIKDLATDPTLPYQAVQWRLLYKDYFGGRA
ncbi:hypothetical protein L198_04532 [Cryptococcus wingfieldii CBS 7118]|uniref:Uncharacterized protein n=1 Tax=Cryptococcus wingfieldii CBS 7118 TaxID=1295528 RepID=A0A1E3J4Z7_9TREE|nr:hypothetical protein L198_04532 [Cryptococcus wingfieldii CBS 7118]ODN95913.1 hypothetical protein L198_04532 [Cryptococcus wingfieldii CBS 7118]